MLEVLIGQMRSAGGPILIALFLVSVSYTHLTLPTSDLV